jgi:hypothetical protein
MASSSSIDRLLKLAGILSERDFNQKPTIGKPAWADWSGSDWTVRQETLKDPNFIRRGIYNLIGDKQKFPAILWAYDGEKTLTPLTLWGNSNVFPKMAKAMYALHPNSKAIFVSGRTKQMVLIALNGKILPNPIPVGSHQAHNMNPENDWDFISTLPRLLAKVAGGQTVKDEPVGDFKAWINVNNNDIKVFDSGKSYSDIVRGDPESYARRGWCAAGVNIKDGDAHALVFAVSDPIAMRGGRILYKARHDKMPWRTLTVKTNEKTTTYRGKDEINSYLKLSADPVYI